MTPQKCLQVQMETVMGSILPGPSFQNPYRASKRKGTKWEADEPKGRANSYAAAPD